MQPRSRVGIPEQTVLVARAAFPQGSVAMSARDELGEVFTDEQFAAAFGVRGAPAESPGALAVAAPQWLATVIDVAEWAHRYGPRVDGWRLPASAAKRERLATVYGTDAVGLLRAIFAPSAPAWLPELPAVQALRIVLVQNY